MANHTHTENPHAPKNFDFAKFHSFCERGFCSGLKGPDGMVCIEAAISLCSGEELNDKPTCVHPVIRAHAIRLNDARWSSPAARAKGTCDYGLAQLGTQGIDGVAFAKRLAFLTITKLLPQVLRLVVSLDPAFADNCEKAADLAEARLCAQAANKGARGASAYAAYAADAASAAASAAAYAAAYAYAYAADAASSAASAAASAAAYAYAYAADAASASASDARDKFLSLGAELATQVIRELMGAGQ